MNLNNTPARGPLTAADFDTYTSPETAMLIGHDTDFVDTMAVPRRQTMPFEPASYRAAMCKADACRQGRDKCATPEACRLAAEDSDFGALDGLVQARNYIVGAWAIIAATAVAAYLIWW